MKSKLAITLAAGLISSCAPKAYPPGTPNPLDRPYDRCSAADLHEQNMQIITSNPGYRLP